MKDLLYNTKKCGELDFMVRENQKKEFKPKQKLPDGSLFYLNFVQNFKKKNIFILISKKG